MNFTQDFLSEEKTILIPTDELVNIIKDAFAKGCSFRFQASGFSMSPFIRDKDILTISQLEKGKINLGMPVAIVHPLTKKLVIHRVIGKKGELFLIKGDNVVYTDGYLNRESILGFVSLIDRKGVSKPISLDKRQFLIAMLSRLRAISFLNSLLLLSFKKINI